MSVLRVIFGDQLSRSISSLKDLDKENDIIIMSEVTDEATYVKHHKKKIAFIFSAMRHFCEELKNDNCKIIYNKLDDSDNAKSFTDCIKKSISKHKFDKIIITSPSEYRVLEEVKKWQDLFKINVEIKEDDRFLCSSGEFEEWAGEKKQLRMEYFYRHMRKRYSILMDMDSPIGGKWNYDHDNRQAPKGDLEIPKPYNSNIDEITKEVIDLVSDKFSDHFGDLEPFYFAVTRDQALYCLDKFIDERLKNFGDYQDAMVEDEPWMYHSHISFYLNCGLLLPQECIEKVENAYHKKLVPLNSAEGFIRQILGWREYIRGIYWLKMPEYKENNFFNAKNKLPDFFWDAETKMNCLSQCIKETKENAYAHHIQRLMVLGNFMLLTGIDPKYVNEWYLIVYADAYEWVELPNVTGMILYADGGFLASKPYAAGGAYINKMSNYCKNCSYKISKKNGEDACPFNYLFWNFLVRNSDKLEKNNRISTMYRTYSKMSDEKKQAIKDDSEKFFNQHFAGRS